MRTEAPSGASTRRCGREGCIVCVMLLFFLLSSFFADFFSRGGRGILMAHTAQSPKAESKARVVAVCVCARVPLFQPPSHPNAGRAHARRQRARTRQLHDSTRHRRGPGDPNGARYVRRRRRGAPSRDPRRRAPCARAGRGMHGRAPAHRDGIRLRGPGGLGQVRRVVDARLLPPVL